MPHLRTLINTLNSVVPANKHRYSLLAAKVQIIFSPACVWIHILDRLSPLLSAAHIALDITRFFHMKTLSLLMLLLLDIAFGVDSHAPCRRWLGLCA